jgi:hypothetical protein
LTDSALNHAALAVITVLPVLLALAAVPLTASRLLRELYGIESLTEAYGFLLNHLFGLLRFSPLLLVKEGRIGRGEGRPLHRVGGPGYLIVYNDSAVVTERCGRLARALGPGFFLLERFEKVYEIVDLRPQRWVLPVKGMTRDGIPVVCEADVHFKIDDLAPDAQGRLQPKQPTDQEPHPYTPEAVFRAATSRWIRDADYTGPPMDWAGRVMFGLVQGTLRNILAEYRLDWLIAPVGSDTEHPRQVIRRRLEEWLRDRAPEVGARVLRVDLGEIQVEDNQIPRQWIEAWQAEWEGRALLTQAEGEAELLRVDVVRARAQAEMVITLTQALQSVVTSEDEAQSYLLAFRFVEALRWMAYDPFTRAYMPPEAMEILKRLQDTLSAERVLPAGKTDEGQAEEA